MIRFSPFGVIPTTQLACFGWSAPAVGNRTVMYRAFQVDHWAGVRGCAMGGCAAMDTQQLWSLIDEARAQADDPADGYEVGAAVTSLLAALPAPEILAAGEILADLMAESYLAPLWGAAYLINGGCSDDGFDYFRGWLITQGQKVFEVAVADADSLADLDVIRAAAVEGDEIEAEDGGSLAWSAYRQAVGEEAPPGRSRSYPELDPEWDFDFDDLAELRRRLPRLGVLYA
jgi:Protein of unknown function (DUF4240)